MGKCEYVNMNMQICVECGSDLTRARKMIAANSSRVLISRPRSAFTLARPRVTRPSAIVRANSESSNGRGKPSICVEVFDPQLRHRIRHQVGWCIDGTPKPQHRSRGHGRRYRDRCCRCCNSVLRPPLRASSAGDRTPPYAPCWICALQNSDCSQGAFFKGAHCMPSSPAPRHMRPCGHYLGLHQLKPLDAIQGFQKFHV